MANVTYSEELGDQIALLIAENNTYEQIAAQDGMPCKKTIINWLKSNESFYTKCACAREIQADSIDNRIGDTIDRVESGEIPTDIARVILPAMQWRAARKNPKLYGDKVDLTTAGKSMNDPKAVDARLAFLLGKAGAAVNSGGEGEGAGGE